jgi:hypothetical protein
MPILGFGVFQMPDLEECDDHRDPAMVKALRTRKIHD